MHVRMCSTTAVVVLLTAVCVFGDDGMDHPVCVVIKSSVGCFHPIDEDVACILYILHKPSAVYA